MWGEAFVWLVLTTLNFGSLCGFKVAVRGVSPWLRQLLQHCLRDVMFLVELVLAKTGRSGLLRSSSLARSLSSSRSKGLTSIQIQNNIQTPRDAFAHMHPTLLTHVFVFLDGVDLAMAQRVCRSWYAQGGQESLWRAVYQRESVRFPLQSPRSDREGQQSRLSSPSDAQQLGHHDGDDNLGAVERFEQPLMYNDDDDIGHNRYSSSFSNNINDNNNDIHASAIGGAPPPIEWLEDRTVQDVTSDLVRHVVKRTGSSHSLRPSPMHAQRFSSHSDDGSDDDEPDTNRVFHNHHTFQEWPRPADGDSDPQLVLTASSSTSSLPSAPMRTEPPTPVIPPFSPATGTSPFMMGFAAASSSTSTDQPTAALPPSLQLAASQVSGVSLAPFSVAQTQHVPSVIGTQQPECVSGSPESSGDDEQASGFGSLAQYNEGDLQRRRRRQSSEDDGDISQPGEDIVAAGEQIQEQDRRYTEGDDDDDDHDDDDDDDDSDSGLSRLRNSQRQQGIFEQGMDPERIDDIFGARRYRPPPLPTGPILEEVAYELEQPGSPLTSNGFSSPQRDESTASTTSRSPRTARFSRSKYLYVQGFMAEHRARMAADLSDEQPPPSSSSSSSLWSIVCRPVRFVLRPFRSIWVVLGVLLVLSMFLPVFRFLFKLLLHVLRGGPILFAMFNAVRYLAPGPVNAAEVQAHAAKMVGVAAAIVFVVENLYYPLGVRTPWLWFLVVLFRNAIRAVPLVGGIYDLAGAARRRHIYALHRAPQHAFDYFLGVVAWSAITVIIEVTYLLFDIETPWLFALWKWSRPACLSVLRVLPIASLLIAVVILLWSVQHYRSRHARRYKRTPKSTAGGSNNSSEAPSLSAWLSEQADPMLRDVHRTVWMRYSGWQLLIICLGWLVVTALVEMAFRVFHWSSPHVQDMMALLDALGSFAKYVVRVIVPVAAVYRVSLMVYEIHQRVALNTKRMQSKKFDATSGAVALSTASASSSSHSDIASVSSAAAPLMRRSMSANSLQRLAMQQGTSHVSIPPLGATGSLTQIAMRYNSTPRSRSSRTPRMSPSRRLKKSSVTSASSSSSSIAPMGPVSSSVSSSLPSAATTDSVLPSLVEEDPVRADGDHDPLAMVDVSRSVSDSRSMLGNKALSDDLDVLEGGQRGTTRGPEARDVIQQWGRVRWYTDRAIRVAQRHAAGRAVLNGMVSCFSGARRMVAWVSQVPWRFVRELVTWVVLVVGLEILYQQFRISTPLLRLSTLWDVVRSASRLGLMPYVPVVAGGHVAWHLVSSHGKGVDGIGGGGAGAAVSNDSGSKRQTLLRLLLPAPGTPAWLRKATVVFGAVVCLVALCGSWLPRALAEPWWMHLTWYLMWIPC